MFSPDGRWLAYQANESGRSEVYVQPFPGPGEARQISADGGAFPRWNPKGGELFYRTGDQWNRWMVVEIELEPTFIARSPRLLFEKASSFSGVLSEYDVAPDGQRFLIVEPMEEFESKQINVVLNWFEELERLVPTDN